jgi:hypothetical protein
MWVVDHLADLESDFSHLHRVDDMQELDGPRFFRLAWRMSLYSGVMRARVASAQEYAAAVASPALAGPTGRRRESGEQSNAELMASNADLFDRREVS